MADRTKQSQNHPRQAATRHVDKGHQTFSNRFKLSKLHQTAPNDF